MYRTLRSLALALCLVVPLALGGCFHQHGSCGKPCGMKQEQCTTCAQKCQMPCPNCPCKTASAADAGAAK